MILYADIVLTVSKIDQNYVSSPTSYDGHIPASLHSKPLVLLSILRVLLILSVGKITERGIRLITKDLSLSVDYS